MSKSLVLMIGVAMGFTLVFLSCGGDDMEDLSSMDIPLAFLSPMAAGDYSVKITITAADIPNQIVREQNVAIVEGLNRTYEVRVNNIPVGDQRKVEVEVFKGENRLFVGSDTVDISSGKNQLDIIVEPLIIINISPSAATLKAIGATMQLSSTVKDENNQIVPGATVNWSSSNPSVANVSSQGRVTARGNGTAIITATTSGNVSDTAAITVQVPPMIIDITITPASATLKAIGDTIPLSAIVRDEKNQIVPDAIVDWSSSKHAVARVSSQGLVTAQGNGTATITARSGNKSGTADITVAQEPNTIKITSTIPSSIGVGRSFRLTATVRDPQNYPIATARVNWLSSNPSVATVNSTGLVTARDDGRTTITAQSGGRSDTVSIVARDITPPSTVTETVSNGDIQVDVNQSNADGFRFEFNEPISGSIKLTDEGGKDLNWSANVSGRTATLTIGSGRRLGGETTYKIEIDVRDGANNQTKRTITFVTDIKQEMVR